MSKSKRNFVTIKSKHGEKGRLLKINDLVVADVIWTDKEIDRTVYNFACMETEMEPLLKANKNLCAVGIRRYNGEKCVHIGIRREKMSEVQLLNEILIGE